MFHTLGVRQMSFEDECQAALGSCSQRKILVCRWLDDSTKQDLPKKHSNMTSCPESHAPGKAQLKHLRFNWATKNLDEHNLRRRHKLGTILRFLPKSPKACHANMRFGVPLLQSVSTHLVIRSLVSSSREVSMVQSAKRSCTLVSACNLATFAEMV